MARSQGDDCGTAMTELTCGEHFDRLLALDHSPSPAVGRSPRRGGGLLPPPASRCKAGTRVGALLYERLERFVGPDLDRESSPHSTMVTIHDVAVDGSFPAGGHREGLLGWAPSILGNRRSE
jgi:hypothetical protein